MRIEEFDLVPYRLALTEAVTWNGERHKTRDGTLLRLRDAEGRLGWGDVAPLPGFSRETLAEARAALTAILPPLLRRDLRPADVLRSDDAFHAGLDAAGLPSSARFAVDLALADLAAQGLGRTLPQALHPDPAVRLPLNGLLMGDRQEAVVQARRLAEAGYEAVKLKVGRGTVGDDVGTVRAVREAVGEDVSLRLDANRAWSIGDAKWFAESVVPQRIEYIEEPLENHWLMPELWLDTGLPIALDETLQEPGCADLIQGWAEAAVLKPTLVGGLMAAFRLAVAAQAVGVRPVLSAAFESGVGLRGIAALAAATGAHPAGLDTYRWLAEDVVGPLPFDRPHVDVPGLFREPPVVHVP